MGRQGRLGQSVSGVGRREWSSRRTAARQHPREGASLCHRRQRGQKAQALGISRGGRTTKIHTLSDDLGRPLAFVLTPGQSADCRAAEVLLRSLPTGSLVMADHAYDTNAVREQIQSRGAVPNIPPKRNWFWKCCFSPSLYRGHNAIEETCARVVVEGAQMG